MKDICKTTVISPYAVLSELISTIYNLSALSKTSLAKNETELTVPEKIKKWLTILEYCETFLELSVLSLPITSQHKKISNGGNKLKWIVVSVVQLAKCTGRMILLLKYKQGLLPHPPLQVKIEYLKQLTSTYQTQQSYVLKSGRRVRSVREVYIEPNNDLTDINDIEIAYELSNIKLITAEAAYIIKPILHLISLYFFGRKSWKPWFLSFTIDILSLLMLYRSSITKNELSIKQKKLLLTRRLSLILYLLRSPFYDRNTKIMFEIALYSLEMYIPCTSKFIVKPLLEHLPLIQQIYFYVWAH